MALITPRRRFLITAPLALLLPAGLLTYLGLETVNLVDKRYEERAAEIVDRISISIRNRAREKLRNEALAPFRAAVVERAAELLPEENSEHFEIRFCTEATPYVHMIFICMANGEILFFEQEAAATDEERCWTQSRQERLAFETRLSSAVELESAYIQNQMGYSLTLEGFRAMPYPDAFIYQQEKRELALFAMLNDPNIDFGFEFEAQQPEWIRAVGFTIDFNYLGAKFFQEIIDHMWQYQDDLPYPVLIYDRGANQLVAQPSALSDAYTGESQRYPPRQFDRDFFPWFSVHFSDQTGIDLLQTANNEKIVYYCLIAAANICMIAAVIGALRDISRELILSDMRSNFVARVSHELRTPLGLIRLFAETLEMGRVAQDEKRKEYLHAITKESERLTNLINNILNFSQIEANKKLYTLRPVPLEDVIIEATDSMEYHLQRHNMTLRLDLESDLPIISCDRESIGQALYNLLSNAVKYSPEGSTITMSARTDDGWAEISIIDEGIGIAPEHHEKIFQEFFRVDNPQVRETGGSGLGLAVVKHIAQGHHGRISVSSEPGKGSTFTLRLPMKQQEYPERLSAAS
jgi:signal transduction histidine kinase